MHSFRNAPLKVHGTVVAVLGCLMGFTPEACGTVKSSGCLGNLRQIEGAADQWATGNGVDLVPFTAARLQRDRKDQRSSHAVEEASIQYSLDDPAILRHLKDGQLPKCPQGGFYFPKADFVRHPPRCSYHGDLDNFFFHYIYEVHETLLYQRWRELLLVVVLTLGTVLWSVRNDAAKRGIFPVALGITSPLLFLWFDLAGPRWHTLANPAIVCWLMGLCHNLRLITMPETWKERTGTYVNILLVLLMVAYLWPGR
jgi:hypothetical protein